MHSNQIGSFGFSSSPLFRRFPTPSTSLSNTSERTTRALTSQSQSCPVCESVAWFGGVEEGLLLMGSFFRLQRFGVCVCVCESN